MSRLYNVIVIGGGPAGMMSAVSAADIVDEVLILEKNEKLGKKLFLTGHGRCNVTNISDNETYERKIFRNARFMRSALARFTPEAMISFLEKHHVQTKQEDSGRVFPESDKSSDIIRAFRRALADKSVEVQLETPVSDIRCTRDGTFVVQTSHGDRRSVSVILATGGVSYPATGSTGDGLRFAERLGHVTTELHPGLAGLVSEAVPTSLIGLALRGSRICIRRDGKIVAQEDGDVLFTHYGLSGPAVFRAACALADATGGPLLAEVNLSGKRTEQEIANMLVDAAAANGNLQVNTVLSKIIPKSAAAAAVTAAGVPIGKKLNQLTREERASLARTIVSYAVPIRSTRPIEEAIVTIGGVSVKSIDPSEMSSRVIPGLYFAGELIDVSAYTGGYNLQIAYSTGKVAGEAAAQYVLTQQRRESGL